MSAWLKSNSCLRSVPRVFWPLTLLGALAGLLLASIPGALLGALLGQVLDRRLQLRSWADLRLRMGGFSGLAADQHHEAPDRDQLAAPASREPVLGVLPSRV